MIIPETPAGAEILINETDIIASNIAVNTGAMGEPNNVLLETTENFTLSQPALIVVSYSLPFFCSLTDGSSPISDGKAKLIRNYFQIYNASTNTLLETAGLASQAYSNVSTGVGSTIAGFFSNNATHVAILPAGTYYIDIYGVAAAVNSTGTSTMDAFRATFGGSGRDTFKVIALY